MINRSKRLTIDTFFKRKANEAEPSSTPEAEPSSAPDVQTASSVPNFETPSSIPVVTPSSEIHPRKVQRTDSREIDIASLERDPGLRPSIWEYQVNQQDEICRTYLKLGAFQYRSENYPLSGSDKHARRFCSSWFDKYGPWLEYSPTKDASFCLHCYLFSEKGYRPNKFVVNGFRM